MRRKLTILCWNVNKASVNRKNLWNKLKRIKFEVCALQEVRKIPEFFKENYNIVKKGEVAFLIKKSIKYMKVKTPLDRRGCLTLKLIINKKSIFITNVYFMHYTSPHVWYPQFYKKVLKYLKKSRKNGLLKKYIIICGDFENARNFKPPYKAISKMLIDFIKELESLGYYDVVSYRYRNSGNSLWTFKIPRKSKKGYNYYQLDYFFAPKELKIIQSRLAPSNITRKYSNTTRISDHRYIMVKILV